MKPGIPWSIKGVEPELREVAKSAARRHGMTLGEWLNSAINEQAETPSGAPATHAKPAPARVAAKHTSAAPTHSIDRAANRLEDIAAQLATLARRETSHAPQASAMEDQMQFAKVLSRVESHEKQTVEAFSAVNDRLATISRQITRGQTNTPKLEESPGYQSLEKAVRNIVEHLEVSDKRTRENMKSLQERLSDMSSRLVSSGNDSLLRQAPAFSALENRLSDLARKLDQPQAQPADQLRQEIHQLSGRVDTLRESSEALASRAQTQAVQVAQAELRGIEARMVALLNEAKQSISANSVGPAELQRFKQEIDKLNARIDDAAKPGTAEREVNALKVAIEQLSTRVAQGQDTRPLAELDRKVLDIAQKLDRAEAAARSLPQATELERRFAELEERLSEQLNSPAQSDPDAIARKLTEVDGRLAQTEQQLGHLATIERAISQLYESLEQSRSQTHDIAHAAARRVADEMGAKGHSSLPPVLAGQPEIVALEQGLDAVRHAASMTDRRNQETLEAVHETLQQVVNRLGDIEAAQTAKRITEAAALAAAPVAAAAMPSAPEADPFVAAAQSLAKGAGSNGHWHAAEEPAADLAEPTFAEVAAGAAAAAPLTEPEAPAPFAAEPPAAEPQDSIQDFVAAARKMHQATQSGGLDLSSIRPKAAKPAKQGGFRNPFAKSPKPEPVAQTGARANNSLFAGLAAANTNSGSRTKLLAAGVLLLALASFGITNVMSRKHQAAPVGDPPAIQQQMPQAPQAAPGKMSEMPSPAIAPQAAPAVTPAAAAPKSSPGQIGEAAPADQPSDPILTAAMPSPQAAAPQPAATVATPAAFDTSIDSAVGPAKLRKSAENGDPTAQFVVASHYLDGDTVNADFAKAAYWYGKAAANGLAPAQYRLATMLERGKGVPKDITKAMSWYEVSAMAGNIKAMHNSAVLAAATDPGPPDYVKAVRWFTEAAKHGLKDSQYNLAVLEERGLGTKADQNEALFWYLAAAAQGDNDAKTRADTLGKAMGADKVAAVKARLKSFTPDKGVDSANSVNVNDAQWNPNGKTTEAIPPNMNDQAKVLLDKIGFRVGEMDGKLDARTANAIKLFQMKSGMKVTGTVTPDLIAAMQSQAG